VIGDAVDDVVAADVASNGVIVGVHVPAVVVVVSCVLNTVVLAIVTKSFCVIAVMILMLSVTSSSLLPLQSLV